MVNLSNFSLNTVNPTLIYPLIISKYLGRGLVFFLTFNIIEHIAGESDKAHIAENAIDTAIHTANCLYIVPDRPLIKHIGTNTAIRTAAIATSEPPTSPMVICVASNADFPSSICRFTFSITTIASSTTTATARTNANKVNRFKDIPNALSAIKVPTKETGIVTQGINVALKSPKNTNIINITISEVKRIVNSTSSIDSLMKTELSIIISSFKESGSVLDNSSIVL